MTDIRCEVDGFAAEGGLWIDAPCPNRATRRYRPAGKPEAEWRFRCAECCTFSFMSPVMVVEEIGEAS